MNVELSVAEHGIVMYALNLRIEACERFAADCEKLTESERKFPTDKPEHWREQQRETKALYERLCSVRRPDVSTLDYMSGGDNADSVDEMYRDEQDGPADGWHMPHNTTQEFGDPTDDESAAPSSAGESK